MSFPIDPAKCHGPGSQFLIQDPFGLRRQILPVITVDREGGLLTGLGTAFKADPFGTFLTAEHVLQDHLEDDDSRAASVATVLYPMGLVYGRVPLERKYFAPINEAISWRAHDARTSQKFDASVPPRIIADVMRFHADDRTVPAAQVGNPLPIRLSGRRPEVGDQVLAIGYPELTTMQREPWHSAPTFTERMYGALGTVTALLPDGRGRTYPWPLIEIQGHWRSGMSGGPVFNDAGEVIGLVSFSLEPDGDLPGVGYATDLVGVGTDQLVPTLDPNNPGWVRGWGVMRSAPWHLAGVFPTHEQAVDFRSNAAVGYEVRKGTHRLGSDDFIS